MHHLPDVTSPRGYPPVIVIWYRREGWVQAVQVVRLVTLVTHQLFFRIVLASAYTARTVFALAAGVVFTEITLWLVLA